MKARLLELDELDVPGVGSLAYFVVAAADDGDFMSLTIPRTTWETLGRPVYLTTKVEAK